MQARTVQAAHFAFGSAPGPEDDDFEWALLRARAEQAHPDVAGGPQPVDASAAETEPADASEWEWLRIRAELDYAASRYEAEAPLPVIQPLDYAASRYEAEVPLLVIQETVLPPPLPSLPSVRIPTPIMALDSLDDDLLDWRPRPRRGWPVLAAAVLCVGVVGMEFTRQLLTQAEQQARIEQSLRDIQAAGPAAVGSGPMVAVARPQAAAPKSETLAAFQRLSQPSAPEAGRMLAPAPRAPTRAAPVRHEVQPRPVAKAAPRLPARPAKVARSQPAAREDSVNLSDDPLFGL